MARLTRDVHHTQAAFGVTHAVVSPVNLDWPEQHLLRMKHNCRNHSLPVHLAMFEVADDCTDTDLYINRILCRQASQSTEI